MEPVRLGVRERVAVERDAPERDDEPDVLRDRDGEVRVATPAGYASTTPVTRVTRRFPPSVTFRALIRDFPRAHP